MKNKARLIRLAKTVKKRRAQGKSYKAYIEVEPGAFRDTDEVVAELEAAGELDDKPDNKPDDEDWPTEL